MQRDIAKTNTPSTTKATSKSSSAAAKSLDLKAANRLLPPFGALNLYEDTVAQRVRAFYTTRSGERKSHGISKGCGQPLDSMLRALLAWLWSQHELDGGDKCPFELTS